MRNRWNRVGLSLCVLALGMVAAQSGAQAKKPAPAMHAAVAKVAPTKKSAAKVAHKSAAHKVARRRHRAHARHLARLHRARLHQAVAEHVTGNGAEDALVGVHLYDNMVTLLNKFGSPDEIQPLSLGSGGGQPTGGFGGGGGGFGGGRMGGGGGRAPGGGGTSGADYDDPFGFGDEPLNAAPPAGMGGGRGRMPPMGGPGGGPSGPPAGYPGYNGPGGAGGRGRPPFGSPERGGAGGVGPAAPMGGGGAAEAATYTRWVYNRNDNKYGFVVDKNGRIIEIEAVGITNPKVETKHGVTFGTDFGTVIRRYGDPDGYDIAGDNITLRYLVHDKVAFKLTRLGPKKPHEVTGIVVAAGKP